MHATCPPTSTSMLSYLLVSSNYEAPHYAVFPTLLLLPPTHKQHCPVEHLINKPILEYQNPQLQHNWYQMFTLYMILSQFNPLPIFQQVTFSSYLTGNTHLHYSDQLVNAVQGSNRS
jgi:hypothetical protein